MAVPPERDVGELLEQLAAQSATLVRQELELARRELADQAREAGVGAAMLSGAGVLGLLSAGAGTAGLVMMLARSPRPWKAALTVSGLYAGGAALLAREGRERLAAVGVPKPEQTIETLKEGPPWRRTRATSGPT
jgi:hypothetical protein